MPALFFFPSAGRLLRESGDSAVRFVPGTADSVGDALVIRAMGIAVSELYPPVMGSCQVRGMCSVGARL